MQQAFEDLIEFESAVGHLLSKDGPKIPDERTRELRKQLITEEYEELITAIDKNDIEGIADSIADLCYVAIGSAVRFGIDIVPVWEATQRANMRKFGPGSWRDETGKIRKPANWEHADIKAILDEQLPLAEIYPQ
jgi:predicted HAD superfamily Cof-like phosphohydrolase